MLKTGSILQNRYRIIRELGHGGMGTVYEALDQRINCLVAIKETTGSDNEQARRAFEREASLLGNLRHAALPKVMDYFTEDVSDYLVMEFIAGDDLDQRLKKRAAPFTQLQVLRWANDILRVLEYLHGQTPPILHRDIKPSNIKVTAQGDLFLLDFGLAKGAVGQMPTLMTSRSVYGYTPVYAALEQILGQGTDHRSDLYSLGATLYHLISGKAPIDAPTRFAALEDEKPDPLPRIEDLNPAVTIDVSVIYQALAIKRNQRPGSASAMKQTIERLIVESERGPEPSHQVAQTVAPPTLLAHEAPIESTTKRFDKDRITTILATPALTKPYEKQQVSNPQSRSRRRIVISALVLLILIGAGFGAWTINNRFRRGFKIPQLTKDDMSLLVSTYDPQTRSRLSSDAAQRQNFALWIRRTLAVAQEAVNKGVDRRPAVQRQIELRRASVLAQYYFKQAGKKREDIPDQEIEAFFKEPGNQAKLDQLNNDEKIEYGEPRAELKREVATSFIGERNGRSLGIHEKPDVKLELMLAEAIVLDSEYSDQDLQPTIKATDAEIDEYLSTHRDHDVRGQRRDQAADLLRRLRNGADFAALAKQFSSDRAKEKGGELGWFGRGVTDKAFEDAAYALGPGEISEIVETRFGYHIIQLEERRTVVKNGKPEEEIRARHILIGDPLAEHLRDSKQSREDARYAVELQKVLRLKDEIVKRSSIIVPDDFPVPGN